MTTKIGVVLYDQCSSKKEYVAWCRDECRDEIDSMVFDLVCQHKNHIKIGSVLGRPYTTGKGKLK